MTTTAQSRASLPGRSRTIPHHPPAEPTTAIDALLNRICRATPLEAGHLAMSLTLSGRAAVALSCNARTHLRTQGRDIAGACTLDSLVREGGQAGFALFNQATAASDTWGAIVREGRRPVSLAG